MTVSEKFKAFNQNIRISSDNVSKISDRYKRITKKLNREFWGTDSETSHSLYVGSYGRDTDIHVSDVDILFQFPYSIYEKYNSYSGNGQSALLQEVKDYIKEIYPKSPHIKGDGQVIGVNWDDGICFEIVPCFINKDNSYTYPDSNNGGSWKTTNPKPEIEEIREKNKAWNYNLKELCRMARAWKDEWSVPMGGLLIDTLSYNFLKNWSYRDKAYAYHHWMVRDFFEYLKNQKADQDYWLAVGSNQYICRKGKFEYKALQCYNISLEAIEYEQQQMPYSANLKWKEIFGSKFNS